MLEPAGTVSNKAGNTTINLARCLILLKMNLNEMSFYIIFVFKAITYGAFGLLIGYSIT